MRSAPSLAGTLVAFAAMASLASACAGRPARSATVAEVATATSEIRRQIARHADAWRRNDADSAVTLYADDAVLQFPDAPDVRGRDAIRSAFTQLFATLRIETLEVVQDTIEVYDRVAFEWGTYREVYRPEGQPAVREEGRYVMRWERQADGEWQITRFAGNSVRKSPA